MKPASTPQAKNNLQFTVQDAVQAGSSFHLTSGIDCSLFSFLCCAVLCTCSFAIISYGRGANGCLQTNTYHNLIHSRTYSPINIVMKHKAATNSGSSNNNGSMCVCVCNRVRFIAQGNSVCTLRQNQSKRMRRFY